MRQQRSKLSRKKIRYAVLGLGHIAQAAVLPAFKHARKNSELVTLVSGDPAKLKKLGKRYEVDHCLSYRDYQRALREDLFDAVYIALPNSLHRAAAVEAVRFGKHILCEKPLGLTARECQQMISAAKQSGVKLMTAYRLHFEKANMEVTELIKNKKIGDPKIFTSTFSFQIKPDNARLEGKLGGGALYDIGIYCINAARYVFKDEPYEVSAIIPNLNDSRFAEVEGTVCATMRFPKGRIAHFTCSFALDTTSWFQVLGTKGSICLDAAYEYQEGKTLELVNDDKSSFRRFSKKDQFAPELLYFSNCILHGIEPETSGFEGLADIRIIEALFESARLGKPVELAPMQRKVRPGRSQVINRPAVPREPKLVRAEGASS